MSISQFARHLILDHCLKGPHRSIKELTSMVNQRLEQDHYGNVTDRTIRNDVERNLKVLYNVEIDCRKHKYAYKKGCAGILHPLLKEEEKQLLVLALQVYRICQGTPFFKPFKDMVGRLIGSQLQDGMELLDHPTIVQIPETATSSGIQHFSAIYHAALHQQSLRIRYTPLGQELQQVLQVSPYVLKEYENRWYLIGHVRRDAQDPGAVKILKLGRILDVEPGDLRFCHCAEFDPREYFAHSLGIFHQIGEKPIQVKLRARGELIQLLVEDPIHPSMRILTVQEDQEMDIVLTVYNSVELHAIIMKFGPLIEVLEPSSLREEIASKLHRTLEQYRV